MITIWDREFKQMNLMGKKARDKIICNLKKKILSSTRMYHGQKTCRKTNI